MRGTGKGGEIAGAEEFDEAIPPPQFFHRGLYLQLFGSRWVVAAVKARQDGQTVLLLVLVLVPAGLVINAQLVPINQSGARDLLMWPVGL